MKSRTGALFLFRRVGADPVAELAALAVWFAFVAFDAAGSERGILAIFFDLWEGEMVRCELTCKLCSLFLTCFHKLEGFEEASSGS